MNPATQKGSHLPSDPKPSWRFLERLPGFPNASGDITRLFNTGDSRPPKSFSRVLDRSSEAAISAAIYGREGVANCVDASLARRDGTGRFGLEISFSKVGAEWWNLLDLDTLAGRADDPEVERKDLGLSSSDCLAAGAGSAMRIMTVRELGGGGMPGSLDDVDSVLTRALLNVGEAQAIEGSAGSYGYGKAAVAQASRVRVILVYTCAPATEHDPVTRRLLGVTYWGMHDVEGSRYTGWALFGDPGDQRPDALTDEAADDFASQLGLPTRDPSNHDDLGTTFVIVDPVFGAADLRGAVELFWWPLLQQSRSTEFQVVIEDEAGTTHHPSVTTEHPELGQFVKCFDRAESARTTREQSLNETEFTQIGEAGVTALETRSADSPIEGSLIAKMRSPLMVVAYETNNHANPPVVGVFVSHDETNEHLRRVEPPEHDKWHARNVAGLNAQPRDLEISRLVRSEVDSAVNALRAPDPPPVHGIAAFSRFFPAVDVKAARPRPPRPRGQRRQRLVRVHLVHDTGDGLVEVDRPTRTSRDDGSLEASAEVRFFLDPERAAKVGKQHLDATISIGARIDEDGTSGEWWPATVVQRIYGDESVFELRSSPSAAPAVFEGRFLLDEQIHFVIETAPYQPDWTIEMNFDCDPWDVVEPTRAARDESNEEEG